MDAAQIFMSPRYITGADGQGYRVVGTTAVQWQITAEGVRSPPTRGLAVGGVRRLSAHGHGHDRGRAILALLWQSLHGHTRMVWVERNSSMHKNLAMPLRDSRPSQYGVDGADNAYICATIATVCYGLSYRQDAPLWSVRLPSGGTASWRRLTQTGFI